MQAETVFSFVHSLWDHTVVLRIRSMEWKQRTECKTAAGLGVLMICLWKLRDLNLGLRLQVNGERKQTEFWLSIPSKQVVAVFNVNVFSEFLLRDSHHCAFKIF